MPPGLRITRSHISTIHAHLNPFHTPTARPIQLFLSLVATPGKTTQQRPAPGPKMAPGQGVNVLVDVLPRGVERGVVEIGYADGKVEKVVLEVDAAKVVGDSKFWRPRRKQEEVVSVAELVERLDAHARVLKAKDEGNL